MLRVANQRRDWDLAFAFWLGDREEIGVRAGADLDAGWARTAGIQCGGGAFFTEQRLSKLCCEGALADAGRADEQIRAGQTAAGDDAAETFGDVVVALHGRLEARG
jgi:hypothetical protein